MKDIVEWLIEIEQLAGNLYRDAAEFFKEDTKLADFLMELGEDEAWHFHIMGSAAEFLRAHPEVDPPQIVLDDATREKIETPFLENQRQLVAAHITKDSILSCIVTTEFSEWNDFFLFVVNSLKERSREFQYVAARMQDHLKHIMDFLETRPEGAPFLEEIRKLPPLWREKILIVEDFEPLRRMLEMVLRREYIIATAEDGRKGLEKVEENYFDVIVSDIDMPEINGIELFEAALRHDPEIARRFLFYSGLITEQHKALFNAHGVPYLHKPVGLVEIKQKVADILARRRNSVANSSN